MWWSPISAPPLSPLISPQSPTSCSIILFYTSCSSMSSLTNVHSPSSLRKFSKWLMVLSHALFAPFSPQGWDASGWGVAKTEEKHAIQAPCKKTSDWDIEWMRISIVNQTPGWDMEWMRISIVCRAWGGSEQVRTSSWREKRQRRSGEQNGECTGLEAGKTMRKTTCRGRRKGKLGLAE